MLVREQMILAVFIIAVAFGTEAEHQIVSILFCASADRTFMHRSILLPLLHALGIGPSPVNLFRIVAAHAPHSEKENQEISES